MVISVPHSFHKLPLLPSSPKCASLKCVLVQNPPGPAGAGRGCTGLCPLQSFLWHSCVQVAEPSWDPGALRTELGKDKEGSSMWAHMGGCGLMGRAQRGSETRGAVRPHHLR